MPLTSSPFTGLHPSGLLGSTLVGLGVREPCLQFVADIAPNQQGDEGADVGVFELGCHLVQAFVYLARRQPVGELSVELISDVQQVRVDLGPT
jgi:hypothetical protein